VDVISVAAERVDPAAENKDDDADKNGMQS